MQSIDIPMNGVTHPKTKKPRRSLKAIERAAKAAPYVPSLDNPRDELRRLVFEHKVMTRKAVAIDSMISDRKSRETGETILCRGVADDRKEELKIVVASMKKDAGRLEKSMTKELRKIPVYAQFLSKVYGVGPVVAAYLIAELDPWYDARDKVTKQIVNPDAAIGTKPSKWRRFCGLAVINGRLERPVKGEKNRFSREMRTRLFQAFASMMKNSAKNGTWIDGEELADDIDPTTLDQREQKGRHQYKIVRAAAPYGVTSKYIDIWYGKKHRILHSERVIGRKVVDGKIEGKIVNGQGKEVSAKGFAHSAGWHLAADVLIEDLYIVWRALEGLPVWPSYYAAKLGYEHGGKISVNAPKMLTVEEALELVGDVGSVPRSEALASVEEDEDGVEELDD